MTNLSMLVEAQEVEEVEDTEPLVNSRRRSARPLVVEEPEAVVLGDLELEEVVESQPEEGGGDGETQSFAFNIREGEELPTEAPVDQIVEETQPEVEAEETPIETMQEPVETSSPPRGQIRTISESTFQTPPAMQSSPGSTSRFYERFVASAARPPTGVWLCCSGHPFFADLPNISREQIAFFDRVFAKEGDIFEGAVFVWEAVKEVILTGLFDGVQELESFSVLDVPDEVIARIARVISTAEKFGIRVDWLDRALGEICSRREHAVLEDRRNRLSNQAAKLREELRKVDEELEGVNAEMASRDFVPGPVPNDKICIIVDI